MPATTTTVPITEVLVNGIELVTGYAKMLVEGIPAERFGHMPHEEMNHPAFCLGHLSIYPDKILGYLGRADLASPKEGWFELFAQGVQCVEQDGRYPEKDEICTQYFERHWAVVQALKEVDEMMFAQPTPIEFLKERAPSFGASLNFIMIAHPMLHLGQISAWRRAMGLGSAM